MTTEERLAKVERELGRAKKRSRWLLVGLALGLGVLALVWASAASAPKAEAQDAAGGRTVRANAFVLENENGKGGASLEMLADVPTLALFYGAGKGGAMLRATADGPRLSLLDGNGTTRAVLRVDKDGPGLNLFDAEGKNRAALTVDKDGGPGLSLFDENGKSRAWLTLPKDGPGLTLFDAAGKGRATLGAGQIVLPDGRIVSYTESSMRLFGPDGNMTWQAPWSAP